MDPVVVGRAFQWLPWIDRFVHFFLLLPEEISDPLSILAL
jgi:hypothetical protein